MLFYTRTKLRAPALNPPPPQEGKVGHTPRAACNGSAPSAAAGAACGWPVLAPGWLLMALGWAAHQYLSHCPSLRESSACTTTSSLGPVGSVSLDQDQPLWVPRAECLSVACTVLCCVLCCAVLCCAVLCCAVLCCAVLCCCHLLLVSSLRLHRLGLDRGLVLWLPDCSRSTLSQLFLFPPLTSSPSRTQVELRQQCCTIEKVDGCLGWGQQCAVLPWDTATELPLGSCHEQMLTQAACVHCCHLGPSPLRKHVRMQLKSKHA